MGRKDFCAFSRKQHRLIDVQALYSGKYFVKIYNDSSIRVEELMIIRDWPEDQILDRGEYAIQ